MIEYYLEDSEIEGILKNPFSVSPDYFSERLVETSMGLPEGKIKFEKNKFRELLRKEYKFGSLKKLNSLNLNFFSEIDSSLKIRIESSLKCLLYETDGKKILDLGCGAELGNRESEIWESIYEPWFPRFISSTRKETGLEIMGIDYGDLSEEKFPNKQMNLLERGILTDSFEENSFDLVNAFMLFNSPHLEMMVSGYGFENAKPETSLKLKDILLPQIEKILRPKGVFLYSGDSSRTQI